MPWGCRASRFPFCALLPPGISFYHFPGGRLHRRCVPRPAAAAESLADYALFISLFPHLIAGPIQRPGFHLLAQVHESAALRRTSGLRRPDAES